MEPLIQHKGIVAVMDRVNVDTDQIIPKQFLKRIERSGFGQFLFYDWRFLEDGSENHEFELNAPQYKGATVLLANHNFGCGSSREHAAWALLDYGFRVVIAPSFADIFHNNCYKNGILPIVLPELDVAELMKRAAEPGYQLTVDLEREVLEDNQGLSIPFLVDSHRRHLLLEGLDDIGMTLKVADAISNYEGKRAQYQLVAE